VELRVTGPEERRSHPNPDAQLIKVIHGLEPERNQGMVILGLTSEHEAPVVVVQRVPDHDLLLSPNRSSDAPDTNVLTLHVLVSFSKNSLFQYNVFMYKYIRRKFQLS
jgi:hypothetical protein